MNALINLPDILACATCLGDPNHPTMLAANGAIFLMLGALVLVLGSVGGFIGYLAKRARAFGESQSN